MDSISSRGPHATSRSNPPKRAGVERRRHRIDPDDTGGARAPDVGREIAEFDVVVLSDIGYNTLALPPATFDEDEEIPNRLQLLEDFVRAGGGLIMIGGYLSFQGFDVKAKYKDSPIEEALPVTM